MDYIIENEQLRVTVSTMGAEMTSVQDKRTGAQLLWNGDPAVWPRHAPILFPYCSRLKDGKFRYKDITYDGVCHGFARDMEFMHVEGADGPDTVSFCLEANALTMEKYPFAFQLTVTYKLSGAAVYEDVRVHNDGDEPMPFAVGFHPAFVCPFDAAHTTEDYAIVFDVPETPTVVETDPVRGIATGKRYPYFTQQTEIPLTDHLFDNDSICFADLKSRTMSLVEKATGRRVTIGIQDFPYVLIWSAKGPVHFVCIEPWFGSTDLDTCSGELLDKPDMVHLAPGADWSTRLPLQFSNR